MELLQSGAYIAHGWWCHDEEFFVSADQYEGEIDHCANCNSTTGQRARVIADA